MKHSESERHAGITSCIAAAICVLLGIALIVMPKTYWSENENRRLSEFPDFSISELTNGEYLSDVDDYLTDHFPFRDLFVSLNTRFSTITGRSEINGVFVCRDGYLIDKYQQPTRTDTILKSFNSIPDSIGDRNTYLMLVPTAACIYSEKLPLWAQQADQTATMNYIYDRFDGTAVDVSGVLMQNRDRHQLYYRTDHHWTTYGAYYAYTELCSKLGLDALPMQAFDITKVTESFCGTTWSKVNDYSVSGEDIFSFSLPGQNLTVEYGLPGKAVVSDSLYNFDYLEQKDKYSFFLDNIHEFITITNPDASTDRRLVIIKDSYANCFVPFLADHFSQINIIDPRYYRDSIIDYIRSDESISDVLILYNLGTMDTDTGVTAIF